MNYDNKLKLDWQEEHISKLENENEKLRDIQELIKYILERNIKDEGKIKLIQILLGE